MPHPTPDQLRRVAQDPDYILLGRFDNSAAKVAERYPDGAPTRVIQQALGLADEAAVGVLYDAAAFAMLRRVDPSAYEVRVEKLKKELRAYLGSFRAEGRGLTAEEEQVVLVGHRFLTLVDKVQPTEDEADGSNDD